MSADRATAPPPSDLVGIRNQERTTGRADDDEVTDKCVGTVTVDRHGRRRGYDICVTATAGSVSLSLCFGLWLSRIA
jgi:hypothetical protein